MLSVKCWIQVLLSLARRIVTLVLTLSIIPPLNLHRPKPSTVATIYTTIIVSIVATKPACGSGMLAAKVIVHPSD
jgi:hypothetical protein